MRLEKQHRWRERRRRKSPSPIFPPTLLPRRLMRRSRSAPSAPSASALWKRPPMKRRRDWSAPSASAPPTPQPSSRVWTKLFPSAGPSAFAMRALMLVVGPRGRTTTLDAAVAEVATVAVTGPVADVVAAMVAEVATIVIASLTVVARRSRVVFSITPRRRGRQRNGPRGSPATTKRSLSRLAGRRLSSFARGTMETTTDCNIMRLWWPRSGLICHPRGFTKHPRGWEIVPLPEGQQKQELETSSARNVYQLFSSKHTPVISAKTHGEFTYRHVMPVMIALRYICDYLNTVFVRKYEHTMGRSDTIQLTQVRIDVVLHTSAK